MEFQLNYFTFWRWCCESASVNMPANLENSAVARGLKKISFHSIPKEGNAKECSDYHTNALISHGSKVMLKILQARLQQHMNWELPDVQAGFRKGRGKFIFLGFKITAVGDCSHEIKRHCSSNGKESACNEEDTSSIPGSERASGEGNGNPLQYSCLENPMDRGAWWATVHGVTKSRTRLSG